MSPADWKATPVQDAGLSTASTNALTGSGYYSMGDVCAASDRELLCIPNFGRKSLREVEQWAEDRGAVAGEARGRLIRQERALSERLAILQRDLTAIQKRLGV